MRADLMRADLMRADLMRADLMRADILNLPHSLYGLARVWSRGHQHLAEAIFWRVPHAG
ncbi:hypothetical protein N8977_02145 [Alphaproteobacteria bacterium]|nr:hypothetical protein [Alphaproteobacteria bacterium]